MGPALIELATMLLGRQACGGRDDPAKACPRRGLTDHLLAFETSNLTILH